ncbi:MAG: collagen-like protein, partial [Acidimicrobiia bacterium]
MSEALPDPCIPCGLHTPKRNTYFDGKLLVARDFTDEQAYHRGHRHLHNSLLHGTGVVCGLRLIQHPTAECRAEHLVLEPGLALDCCGREVIVPERVLIPLKELLERDQDLADALDGTRHLRIGLRRCDTGAEPVPVILPDCGPADARRFSRVAEGFEFVLEAVLPTDTGPPPFEVTPALEWVHTFAFEAQLPHSAVVNEGEHLVQVAVQNPKGGGRLHLYSSDTHALTRLVEGPKVMGGSAASRASRLIFATGTAFPLAGGEKDGVAVWRASSATGPESGSPAVLGEPAPVRRIAVGPGTGELFVLGATAEDDPAARTARLRAYSANALEAWLAGDPSVDPEPEPIVDVSFPHGFGDEDGPAGRGAAMMQVSPDGRFLALASLEVGANEGLYLIDISALHSGALETPEGTIAPAARPPEPGFVPAEGARIVAVQFSHDSKLLYVLSELEGRSRLDRWALTGTGNELEGAGRGASLDAAPLDLAIGPREAYGFLLVRAEDRSYLTTMAIEPLKVVASSPLEVEMARDAVRLEPDGRNLTLTSRGDRAFVTARAAAGDPPHGSVAVIDISEADCSTWLTRPMAGCPSCDDSGGGVHAVVLGHLPGYVAADAPRVVDPESAA